MLIIYLVFFVLLDFLIFCYLTKKVELSVKIRIAVISSLFIIIVLHFSGITMKTISNSQFYILLIFSLLLLVFNFGIKFVIWIMAKTSKSDKAIVLTKAFNFIRYYLIYILVLYPMILSKS
jgi:hypothetical protein